MHTQPQTIKFQDSVYKNRHIQKENTVLFSPKIISHDSNILLELSKKLHKPAIEGIKKKK